MGQKKYNGIYIKFVLGGIFLLGLFLRLYRIGIKSLWFDEALVLLESQRNLKMLFNVNTEGIHPPLYRLLMHFWMHMGESEAIVRIPSLIFSALSIILIYKIAKLIFNKRVGLYSAFFLSVSPFQVYYAQEVKMYSLLLFLSLFSIYFFLKVLREDKIILWIGYIFFSSLAIYTHYFGFLNILVQSFFLIANFRKYKNLIFKWLAGQLIIFLIFSPWISNFIRHFTRVKVNFWISPVSLQIIPLTFKNFILGYYTSNFNIPLVLFSVFIIFLIGIRSILNSKVSMENGYLLWDAKLTLFFVLNYLFLPIIIIFFFSKMFKPIYIDRALIVFSSFYYIILAKGIDSVQKNKVIFSSIILSIIIIFGMGLKNYYCGDNLSSFEGLFVKKPFRELSKYLSLNYVKGDTIVISHHSLWPSFVYYCPEDIKKHTYLAVDQDAIDHAHTLVEISVLLKDPFNLKIANMGEITKERKGVWVIISDWSKDSQFISARLQEWMNMQNLMFKNSEFTGVEVYYFNKNDYISSPLGS